MILNQLLKCTCGESGIIANIDPNSTCSTRLQELGLYPGQTFEILQCGDTMRVRLGDTSLCLRADQVEGISVLPFQPTFDPTLIPTDTICEKCK